MVCADSENQAVFRLARWPRPFQWPCSAEIPGFGSDKSLVSEGFEGRLGILTVRVATLRDVVRRYATRCESGGQGTRTLNRQAGT